MWAAVKWLDAFGVEVRGIERVGEDERAHTSIADAGWLWLSANTTISVRAICIDEAVASSILMTF